MFQKGNKLKAMKLIVLFSFLFFCRSDTDCPFVNSSQISDRRTNSSRLRLMQYNVEWLFIDQFGSCPGSGCAWANQTHGQNTAMSRRALSLSGRRRSWNQAR